MDLDAPETIVHQGPNLRSLDYFDNTPSRVASERIEKIDRILEERRKSREDKKT